MFRGKVTIHAAGQAPREVPLEAGRTLVLGRGHQVDVRLRDRVVSRRHASVELRDDGHFHVTDLGSRNGTFVGPERIPPRRPQRVVLGKLMRMGVHALTVDLVEVPPGHAISDRHLLSAAPPLPRDEFEVLGELGSGAVGRVWAARQLRLNRLCAVKELRAELDPSSEERERFLREARLFSRIKSKHVVELYDYRVLDGRPYLVMELVMGPNARTLVDEGIAVPEVLRLAEDVGRALQALSEAGIVHRDVKPHNILVDPDGVAKLADFGIARELDGTSLTRTGLGLGTLPYVAPEQANDGRVEPRTDLYSLGASMHHLLAGRPPFQFADARSLLELLREILETPPPPPSRFCPSCPPEVDAYLARLLAKRPQDRPASGGQVAEDLRALRTRLFPDYTRDSRLHSSSVDALAE